MTAVITAIAIALLCCCCQKGEGEIMKYRKIKHERTR